MTVLTDRVLFWHGQPSKALGHIPYSANRCPTAGKGTLQGEEGVGVRVGEGGGKGRGRWVGEYYFLKPVGEGWKLYLDFDYSSDVSSHSLGHLCLTKPYTRRAKVGWVG